MFQFIKKYLVVCQKNWKRHLKEILSKSEQGTFQDLIIRIMDSILNKNTHLVPITKKLAEVFYETVKDLDTFSDETLEKVIGVLKMAYVKNKQNLDLLKELVPLVGLIFKKFSNKILDETLIEMLEHFSSPEKPEEARYAVSRALKHIFNEFTTVLNLPI